MKRALLLRNLTLYTRHLLRPPPPPLFNRPNPKIISPPLSLYTPQFRLFSTENDSPDQNPNPSPPTDPVPESSAKKSEDDLDSIEDVSNKELKLQVEKYFDGGNEEVLPTIFESILKRKLKGNHEDTDDELMHELRMKPIDNVKDEDFEEGFDEAYSTDSEIENLYDARDIVVDRTMKNDEFLNMDNKKWDEMVKEAVDHGILQDTKECEEILEDMIMWENVIPDSIKKKIKKRYNEIAAMVETGELAPEKGLEMYQEFEDKMLKETAKMKEKDAQSQFDDAVPDMKKDPDDPPGEGPILRWEMRVVFVPGNEAWHPKNRKVKLAVTVKELGLSKPEFRRLRELVGKRYNPGKDELTITSERYEHREENKKDCLRTLFSIIEESGKAKKLVEDARTSHLKNELKANKKFMERLHANKMKRQESIRSWLHE